MRHRAASPWTTALLAGLALTPTAQAQIVIDIGVQANGPYGYYDYAPYSCAPMGYYGPSYFYNGIFLGMGPWAGWGYGHGWGSHRFSNDGGGRYHGGARSSAGHAVVARNSAPRSSPATASHAPASHTTTSHATPSHATASHAASSGGQDGGGQSRGGDGHGGGDGRQ